MTTTQAEKREATLKAKLLQLLSQFPGTLAGNIPMAQRRFLREMEKAGLLECRVEHNDFKWYVNESNIAWTDDGFYHRPSGAHPSICAGCTSDEAKHGKAINRTSKVKPFPGATVRNCPHCHSRAAHVAC